MNSFMFNLGLSHPIIGIIIAGLMFVLGISILILMPIMYLRFSSGLYKLAKKNELSNAWLSYLPILQIYIMVRIVGDVKIFSYKIPRLEMILPILAILSVFTVLEIKSLYLPISYIMLQVQIANELGIFYTPVILIGKICSIISAILIYITVYNIYKIYRPNSIAKTVIISIITLGCAIPFYIYKIGNDASNASNNQPYLNL